MSSGLQISYPEALPVSRERDSIVSTLKEHPVVIVCGDTGSGKTTQLPKMIHEALGESSGKIAVTQPRRLAATSMAKRVAEECGVDLGTEVGVKIRFQDRSRKDTRIQFMTDGLLLAQLPRDPLLKEYDAVLIDEAHERSLNIDFLIGCLKDIRRRRPGLKVILSSATLDAERFAAFFEEAPVLSVEGRLFPIQDLHLAELDDSDLDLSDQVLRGLEALDREQPGLDTLVFLPGEREIHDTRRKLEGRLSGRADVLPLFARLSNAEQQQVFHPGERRRIILATNVAETSVTLPGIRAVIDCGMQRLQRYHPQSGVQRLVTESISLASARQRRGRCGRTAPGVCVRLYSEERLEAAPAYSDPEILRSSLAEVILRMAVLGLPPIREFEFLDPPRGAQIAEGLRCLIEIGAFDEQRELTRRGRRLASFNLDPRLARMLEEGHEEQVLAAVIICCAFLSIQDPRERPLEKQQQADQAHAAWREPESDFLGMLNLWNAIHSNCASRTQRNRFARAQFLHPMRLQEWINVVEELRQRCVRQKWDLPSSIGEIELLDNDALHRSLLAGVPRSIGERRDGKQFLSPGGKNFLMFPGSALSKKPPSWVFAFSLVETSRLFARDAAKLDPVWVEEVAPQLCRYQYERPVWNPGRGFVEAEERVSLGQLCLRQGHKVHYGRIQPEEARRIFIEDALLPGELKLKGHGLPRYRRLLASLERWEHKLRLPGFFQSGSRLRDHFEQSLPAGLSSTREFAEWSKGKRWVPELGDLVGDSSLDEAAMPDHWELNGVEIALDYLCKPEDPERDGITLRLKEADLELLPMELMEWCLPAQLPEKVEALIRSLDKSLRSRFQPAHQVAAEACSWMAEQNFLFTHSLYGALAAFLAARMQGILAAADLHPEKLPAHLKFKLCVLNEEGRELYRGTTWPGREQVSRKRNAPKQNAWERSGLKSWPDEDLPLRVELEGRTRYPALSDEGKSVGIRLYHSASAADRAHARGVQRLFRLQRPDAVKYLEKKLPLPTMLQLDLAALQALPDLIDRILAESLGLDQSLPRDAQNFQQRVEQARGDLFEVAERIVQQLRPLFEERSKSLSALEKALPEEAKRDLELQQSTLWAPGWLQHPDSLRRYPRYLQGIVRRVDRLQRDHAKDAMKQRELEPALALLSQHSDHLDAGQLREAFLKLEDLRLSLFAPELKPFEKISLQRFERWLLEGK